MARETKEQVAARIAHYNEIAASLTTGAVYVSELFGDTTLGPCIGRDEWGYDNYHVYHSGYTHVYSSASVVVCFAN